MAGDGAAEEVGRAGATLAGAVRRELAGYRPHRVVLQFTPGMFRRGRMFGPEMRTLAQAWRGWSHAVFAHETWADIKPRPGPLARWVAGWRRQEIARGMRALRGGGCCRLGSIRGFGGAR